MTDPITALVLWNPSGTFVGSVQLRQRPDARRGPVPFGEHRLRLQTLKTVAALSCADEALTHVHPLRTS